MQATPRLSPAREAMPSVSLSATPEPRSVSSVTASGKRIPIFECGGYPLCLERHWISQGAFVDGRYQTMKISADVRADQVQSRSALLRWWPFEGLWHRPASSARARPRRNSRCQRHIAKATAWLRRARTIIRRAAVVPRPRPARQVASSRASEAQAEASTDRRGSARVGRARHTYLVERTA